VKAEKFDVLHAAVKQVWLVDSLIWCVGLVSFVSSQAIDEEKN
jgi:hypothetical protein